MANGFSVNLTEDAFKKMESDERDWMLFSGIQEIHKRVIKLEKRTLFNKACSAFGGIVGGTAAFLGLKIGAM